MQRRYEPVNDHVSLCFSQIRHYPITLRDGLRREGLWEDLEQEIHLTAWQAERGGLGVHETCLLAGRQIEVFLKAYGYHRIYHNGHKSYCKDKPLSSIAEEPELQERVLAKARPISEVETKDFVGWKDLFDGPAPKRADFVRDHPEEAILTMLRKTTGGMSKRDLYDRLVLTASELDRHCAPLIERGLVVEVKRQNTSCPLTPLLLAVESGQQLPLQVTDRDERIRHAYFKEGKSKKRIAREGHHCIQTVRKAIPSATLESPRPVAGYRCLRCGHTWVPRLKAGHRRCPKCKTAYWDSPRRAAL